ncbi:DNA primase [Piscinibacter sakaiensis]|uniref:DNA primase n=1 Tax=Piscinibacter sakaiensis TaxID=1547922 RepID=UPI003AAB81DE
MIPPSFVQDLLSRIDIVEVVGRHVQLRKGGANLMGLCPFHGEKSPSFSVSPSKQFYYCFGCGASGNAIGFLCAHLGMGFVEAVEDLAQQAGMTVPQDERTPADRQQADAQQARQSSLSDVLRRAADHYRRELKSSTVAIDYLKSRGLTGEIAARFGLGFAPPGWRSLASIFPSYDDPLLEESGMVIVQAGDTTDESDRKRYDRFRDRIMFPIRSVRGEVIGFGGRVLGQGEPKYLNSPETPIFSKGRELYGLHEARTAMRQRGYALVVEGYMDVVALAQSGFANAVATLGTACTAEHVSKLLRFTDSVVFSFDGDAAGRRAAGRALEAALPHATDTRSIRFLFLPTEHDPDSYVRELGAEAFQRCIESATPLSKQLLEVAKEGCDLGSAEGRAKFVAMARPLWTALPDGSLQRQLLREIASIGGLEAAELAELWRGQTAPRGASRAPVSRDSAVARPAAAQAPRTRAPSPGRLASRRPPSSPADQAIRMLMLHSDWWEQLPADDHDLLHAMPAPHGEVIAWLERQIAEHGPMSWAELEQAQAAADPPLPEVATVPRAALEDELSFSDLRRVLDGLRIEQLRERQNELIGRISSDAAARSQWQELDLRRKALLKALASPEAG